MLNITQMVKIQLNVKEPPTYKKIKNSWFMLTKKKIKSLSNKVNLDVIYPENLQTMYHLFIYKKLLH